MSCFVGLYVISDLKIAHQNDLIHWLPSNPTIFLLLQSTVGCPTKYNTCQNSFSDIACKTGYSGSRTKQNFYDYLTIR